MKNWKIPSIVLVILILAFAFRWGDLGSTTNNGTTIKTKDDHWNGSIWQDTIKNGSYVESMINSGWIEASRKTIDKQVEYQEPVYTKIDNPNSPKYAGLLTDKAEIISSYVTKTKTVQVPPYPLYWFSSNGLSKIWTYIVLTVGIWFIFAVAMTQKKKKNNK